MSFSHRWGITIHTVFTTKYRRPLLDGCKVEVEKAIQAVARCKGYTVEAINIQADHVHLLVTLPANVAPSTAIMHMKSWASYRARKEYPELKKTPALWGKRYWLRTISSGPDRQTVEKYIANQFPKGKSK